MRQKAETLRYVTPIYVTLQASIEYYDSYESGEGEELTDDEYGGTGVFSLEDTPAADERDGNGVDKRTEFGSADYSSLFATVREKYLRAGTTVPITEAKVWVDDELSSNFATKGLQ